MLVGKAKSSSQERPHFFISIPHAIIIVAELNKTNIERRPPEIPIPRKAEIIPKKRADIKIAPHRLSFC